VGQRIYSLGPEGSDAISSYIMRTRKHFSTFVRKITLIIVISSIPI